MPLEGLLKNRTGSKYSRVGPAEIKQRIGLAFILPLNQLSGEMGSENNPPPKQENAFNSLILNILLPVVVLTQGDRFIESPGIVLVIALAFPVTYFGYDFQRRRKANFISILGFVSVLLTGGVGLLQLPRFWFILKETTIPGIIGLVVAGSLFTKKPLISWLVYSPQIFDVDRINAKLAEKGTASNMNRLLRQTTGLLAGSFFVSAILNFVLASHFVKTEPSVDPVQFNSEVGAMTGWSYLVIAVPSMLILIGILFWLAKGIRKFTGLSFEEALAEQHREK